jgi:apolipoprotein D and lipocalin family protein
MLMEKLNTTTPSPARPGAAMRRVRPASAILFVILTMGCRTTTGQPLPTVDHVDLNRFMGDWYVIATIPTPFEQGAHNAVEQYALADDGHIATTFSYNKDGFDGPRKTMHAKGFVRADSGNAVWGMQFIWPFKADYRVVFLDADYSLTIIGRDKRDYVWVMSRSPQIAAATLDRYIGWLAELGYDTAKLVKIPQSEAPAAH